MAKCKKCGEEKKCNTKGYCSECESKENKNIMKDNKGGKAAKVIGIILIIYGGLLLFNFNSIFEAIRGLLFVLLGASLLPIVYEKFLNKVKIKNFNYLLPIILIISLFLLAQIEKKVDEYSDDTEKSDIQEMLDLKERFKEFKWPSSDIAALIPVPKSNYGVIEWEASDGFVIYVGNTSIDDYSDYVDACAQNGFTQDYRKGDDYYYADNIDGYHLSLNYEGEDVMFIRMDAPEDESSIDDNNDDNVSAEENNNQETKKQVKNKTTKKTTSDASKHYKVGESLSCKYFEVKLEDFSIKPKGTSLGYYLTINDPEWIGVILTVKNIDDVGVHTFYTSQAEIKNSNGEFIEHSALTYDLWGDYMPLDSPELAPGGVKTGYIQFANSNQDNESLELKIDCEDKLLGGPVYTFDLKK